MADIVKDITYSGLQQISARITQGVGSIIEQSKRTIAVYLNSTISMTYWNIGRYIAKELEAIGDEKYGSKIVATVSRQLTEQHGKGYTRDAIFRMVKVAKAFTEEEIVGTLSRQLSWSHFIELAEISDTTKRLFYQQMSILYHWSVRQLRDQGWIPSTTSWIFFSIIAVSAAYWPLTLNSASSSLSTKARWNFTSSTSRSTRCSPAKKNLSACCFAVKATRSTSNS